MQASQPIQAKPQVSNGPVAAGGPVTTPSTSAAIPTPPPPGPVVTPLKPIISTVGNAPVGSKGVSVVTLSAERPRNPGGQVSPLTAFVTKTGAGVARVTTPHGIVGPTGGQIRPGITTKVQFPQKVLNLSGATFPAGYKLSPLTFNIATSANGKSGVVPLVLATSSSGNTVSLVPAGSAAALTAAGDEPAKKRPRLEGPIATLRTTAGGTVGKAPDPNSAAAKRRRRTTEDGVKGLRYFATKVCDKVREKNLTTYNSVAEDLVQEYSDPNPTSKSRDEIACEQKNIRRRVYDALNVLMAINVIQKERKQIRWVGLPRSLSEAGVLKKDSLTERRRQLGHLRQRLFQSSLQYVALKELAESNKRQKEEKLARLIQEQKAQPNNRRLAVTPELLALEDPTQRIELPFLFLTCGSKCDIECSVSGDAKEYELRFSEPFQIIEDAEIIRHSPLIKAVDSGTHNAAQLQHTIEQLPEFMRPRFAALLSEHRERVRKLEDTKKAQLAIKAAAEAERARHEAERRRQALLRAATTVPPPSNSFLALAAAPSASGSLLRAATVVPAPIAPAPSAAPEGAAAPEEAVPEAQSAQVAALHSGSPVCLKSKYYMEVSAAPLPPDMNTFMAAPALAPLPETATLSTVETETGILSISAVECT
ncbi:uncharacterized protein LOC129598087 [Paramacrobiotus metropolitanus]|uniref:uncharacterized protein LOC129598087 n=1 Tax=Paramacrobiotus metropolitanus TaxID=2943436 RepID=UPI002445E2CE|nr:uncharacterized protein LOC129598087 [Paramacrobiotus metropolitanus]